MCTHFYRKSSVFPVIKNSNFQIFPKSSPRPLCGVRKCGKKLEKHRISFEIRCFYGCGGRTRTYDLRVMSPTSYQLLYSAISSALAECLYILPRACPFVKLFFHFFVFLLSTPFSFTPALLSICSAPVSQCG